MPTGLTNFFMEEMKDLRETLKIITLEDRFKASVELLQCNRMVKYSLGPRLRELVSRGWQRVSAFFNPGQSITDLEMMAQANSVRKITSQEIGEFDYIYTSGMVTITLVAALDEQGRPYASAELRGSTQLIYGDTTLSQLATGDNVTEAIAKAKDEIHHRDTVRKMMDEVMEETNDNEREAKTNET